MTNREVLGRKISISCCFAESSIKLRLTLLRKIPWVRKDVEELYLRSC